ncbi:MAG: Holliday junction branch migration protein RuvA [Candidatus Peregrinibacteria bacterium]
MIAHLKGKVLKKTDKGIILSAGNVGYFVRITKDQLEKTAEKQEAEFFIHTNVKEDALDLYGFAEYDDLEFFNQLISINGIGPKVGMEILNVPREKTAAAIANEDEAFICKIPGIGKKTAKRVIMELKDKIQIIQDRPYRSISQETHGEAVDALIKLGYQRHEVKRLLGSVPEEISETEEIITYILKNS